MTGRRDDLAIAVLAAGTGSRLGGAAPKPLVPLGGRPLMAYALDAALDAGMHPVLLVVGHRGGRVGDAAPAGVSVVRARAFRRGIAHSLRAALDALEGWARVQAVCVGLADQPRVGSGAYRRLAAAYDDGAALAVATYGGERGNPVLLGRPLWPEARRLTGDEGARALMRTHPVVEVPCDGTGDPTDIDTIEALHAMERTLRAETEKG
jgi:molybdenum cofactor cytidylyltransferase/nicotine blue oxidoreductase